MPPSTWPQSPTVTRSTRTSPLITPSTWISPPPEMLPSSVISLAISEASFWPRRPGVGVADAEGEGAAGRGSLGTAGASGFAGGAGPGGGLVVVLLNLIAGLHKAHGGLGAAIHPRLGVARRPCRAAVK